MTTMLRTENLKENIAAHSLGRHRFYPWGENDVVYWYHVVEPEMEPSRDPFWGYCPEDESCFISQNVTHDCRGPILQVVYHRISFKLGHLAAVEFVLRQNRSFPHRRFIRTMSAFYSQEANSLRESGANADSHAKDIFATESFLNKHKG